MSKRNGIFGQGRPENPYEERDDGGNSTPVRATAAQMAARKIKTAKGRRPVSEAEAELSSSQPLQAAVGDATRGTPATSSPGQDVLSSSALERALRDALEAGEEEQTPPATGWQEEFSPALSTATLQWSLGVSVLEADRERAAAPSSQMGQQATPVVPGGGQFGASTGGGASNPFAAMNQQASFPPAQASTPGGAFPSQSFPTFGGSNAGGSSFQFNAPGGNPFAPTTNTNGAGSSGSAFSGSIFNFGNSQSQPANTTTVAGTTAPNNAPSTNASSNNMFGQSTPSSQAPFAGFNSPSTTANAAPSTNMFGTNTGSGSGSGFVFGQNTSTQNSPFASAPSSSNAAPNTLFGSTKSGAQSSATSGSVPATSGFGGFKPSASAAPSASPFSAGFSTTSSTTATAPAPAPSASPFGTGFSTAPSTAAPASATAPSASPFGAGFSTATSTAAPASAPAPSPFGGAKSSSGLFGGLNAGTPKSSAPALFPSAPAASPFSGGGSTTSSGAAPATEITPGLFSGLHAGMPKTSTPASSTASATSLFGSVNTTTSGSAAPASAPAPSLFSGFNSSSSQAVAPGTDAKPFGGFEPNASSSIAPSSAAPAPSLFSKSTPSSSVTPASTPASTMFGGFKKTEDASAPKPPSTTPFSTNPSSAATGLFQTASAPSTTPASGPTQQGSTIQPPSHPFSLSATTQPSSNPFFVTSPSTPQGPSTSSTGLFSAPPKSNMSSLGSLGFSKRDPPKAAPTNNPSSGFEMSKQDQPKTAPSFSNPPSATTQNTSLTDQPNAVSATVPTPLPKDQAQSDLPDVPKAHIPQDWKYPSQAPKTGGTASNDVNMRLVQLSAELGSLNEKYRQKILSLPPMSDWTSLSTWHSKRSAEISKKIIAAKKERAAAMGITGNESALSTKRKAESDAVHHDSTTTPNKKARAATSSTPAFTTSLSNGPVGQAPQPTSNNKDQSKTSGLFGSVLSKPSNTLAGSATPPAPAEKSPSTSLFSTSAFGKTPTKDTVTTQVPSFGSTTPKGDAPKSTFQTSAFGNNTPKSDSLSAFKVPAFGSDPAKAESTSAFKVPSFGNDVSKTETASASGFKVPSFGTSSSASSFMGQFAGSAKTVKQLTRERKEKAMPEEFDFDSDDSDIEEETKQRKKEWSAKWDKDDAERIEKEKQGLKTASTFQAQFDTTSATSKSPFVVSKPATGASSVFSSRVGSPAPSASASVFDAPSAAPSPGGNIFGHLSSGPSSNNHDDSSDDEDKEESQSGEQSSAGETSDAREPTPSSRKRKQSESGDESEETLEETLRRKKTTSKPSLLSRMTNADGSQVTSAEITARIETETDEGSTTPKANPGTQTPQSRFPFFDFNNAAPKTAPSKPLGFGGDQTFKPGDEIKFSTPSGDGKSALPSFKFQPASPTPPASAPKPISGSNAFAFLNKNPATSAPPSATSSVFSSRAVTPSSDAATDNENEEEVTKAPQLDLSELTEDERAEHNILFHTDSTIAKHLVDKKWAPCGRGQLWILEHKETKKAIVRLRNKSGNIDVNYYILPSLEAKVVGASGKQVSAVRSGEDSQLLTIFFALKTPEIAQDFVSVYNKNLG